MTSNSCTVGAVQIGSGRLAIIAGPCVAESLELCLEVAETLAAICERLDIGYIFKASYDKANRSSGSSFRGPGLERGLGWLGTVRDKTGAAVLSDVHDVTQVSPAAQVLDCIQIPAFLCRQTDLL
ncbi:MAG: 3-deoxy-8-phosphooctulonate synthase, partial [Phycisphaerae bacterium]|nr:3-deoxy-8-phosphooctulonate synthase [Phycisphaerae bacterium]